MERVYHIFTTLLALLVIGIASQSCGKTPVPRGGRIIRCNVSGVATKGATMTTDNKTAGNVSIQDAGFVMNAYAESDWVDHADNETTRSKGLYFTTGVSYNESSTPKWRMASEQYWLNNISLTFWSWDKTTNGIIGTGAGKVTQPSYTLGTGKLSFSYELPAHTTANTDAASQKDIVFAYNSEIRQFKADENEITGGSGTSGRSDEYVDIHFYHALSEVLFAISPADGSFDKTVKIKDISIKGVKAKGDCVFTGASGKNGFSWNLQGDAADFTQTYNADFSGYVSTATDKSISGWTLGTYVKDKGQSTEQTYDIYSCDEKFFMIPQTLGTDARIMVTFIVGGVETALEQGVNGDVWNPGYYYKYKINYDASGGPVKFSIKLVDWDPIDVPLEY